MISRPMIPVPELQHVNLSMPCKMLLQTEELRSDDFFLPIHNDFEYKSDVQPFHTTDAFWAF